MTDNPFAALTPRESEILTRLASGDPASDKVLMAEFCIARGTLHTHLRSIYRALRVRNRTAAAVMAIVGFGPPWEVARDE